MEVKLSSAWYTLQNQDDLEDEVEEIGIQRGGRRRKRGKKKLPGIRYDAVVRSGKRLSVCYAMHSSLQEVVDTIDFLKPEVVTPLVVPFGASLAHVSHYLTVFAIKLLIREHLFCHLGDRGLSITLHTLFPI